MTYYADGERVVNAICELRPGQWDASEGELIDGVLVMRPARRQHDCCGKELDLIVEVAHPNQESRTWGLWRCKRCERSYSIGPKLPNAWIGAIARVCIELYCDYRAAVATARDTDG